MTTSLAGYDLIKRFESCILTSYLCPAKIWTIGWGHTGAEVRRGMVITQERADELLRIDVRRFEKGIDALVKVPLAQNQYDALVCFTFNIGVNAFSRSTMRRLINKGEMDGASLQFGRWVKAGGKTLPGLVRRRVAEMRMFLGEGE